MSKDHKYVKAMLRSVPGVKEHMNKTAVQMGIKIFKLRLDQGLTRQQVAEKAINERYILSEQTIDNLEASDERLPDELYHIVYSILLDEKEFKTNLKSEEGDYNGKSSS